MMARITPLILAALHIPSFITCTEPRQVVTYRRARFLIQDELPLHQESTDAQYWTRQNSERVSSQQDGRRHRHSDGQRLIRSGSIDSSRLPLDPTTYSGTSSRLRPSRTRECSLNSDGRNTGTFGHGRFERPARQLSRSSSLRTPSNPARQTSQRNNHHDRSRPTGSNVPQSAYGNLAEMYQALQFYDTTRPFHSRHTTQRYHLHTAEDENDIEQDIDDSSDSSEEILAQLSTPAPR